jgi:hypothetical protein
VVRIAICSLVRLGDGWNFVQFIVLMEWIRFHCTEVEHGEDRINELGIAQMPYALENSQWFMRTWIRFFGRVAEKSCPELLFTFFPLLPADPNFLVPEGFPPGRLPLANYS